MAVVGVWAVAVAGCAPTNVYTVATLPPEFEALPVENVQTVDLSHFGGPLADSETIDRGDVLEISLAAALNSEDVVNLCVRVGEDGTALLPEVGLLQLAGLHLMEAEQQIAAACVHRGLYRQPHVTVSVKRQRTNRVTVLGGVKDPGVHELPRGSSYLMAALVSAGGLSDDAGTKVEIRSPPSRTSLASQPSLLERSGVVPAGNTGPVGGQPQRVCLNLTDAVGETAEGVYLDDGSVVRVEKRQPEPVQVVGLVQKPGEYEYPMTHDFRLFGAIAQAGGLASRLADKVIVLRKTPGGQGFVVIKVSLSEAKQDPKENLRLAPGDIVSVEQTAATVVSDVLGKVIRFGMSASMPLF